MPPVSRSIIIASVIVFLLQASGGGALLGIFALWPTPEVLLLAPWQLFSIACCTAAWVTSSSTCSRWYTCSAATSNACGAAVGSR